MLYEKIMQDYKDAFKNKNAIKKGALNYVISLIKNKQIELHHDLTDDDVIAIIKKEIKSRHESLTFLHQSGKTDEVEQEKEIINILEAYLPPLLNEQQIAEVVREVALQNNIIDYPSSRSQLTKLVMEKYRSVIDGKMLQEVLASM